MNKCDAALQSTAITRTLLPLPPSANIFTLLVEVLCLLLLASSPHYGTAQTTGTGAIQGTVSDNSSHVIQGAIVTAVNTETAYTVSQPTSTAGNYVLPQLPPGTYTVTSRAAGFDTLIQQHVIVNAMEVVGLDLTMKVGQVNETVTVSSIPPQLDTSNGTLETTIPGSTYTALPLAVSGSPKVITAFLNLVPGAYLGGPHQVPNFNGGPGESSAVYLNGMPIVTDREQGDTSLLTAQNSTEVVDQFQVITSGVPAYYTGQGVSNFVLKSGTNAFHGRVYENFRNTIFDAGGYFTSPALKPIERQNEYGALLGGPIVKNRVFFFGNFDGFRYSSTANPALFSIPTLAERTGDFSALPVPIYDPASQTCVSGICTRQQFQYNGVLNVIPPNEISSISKYLQSFLPQPSNSALQNNYVGAELNTSYDNMYLGKADITVTNRNHLYVLMEYGSTGPIGHTFGGGNAQLPLPYTSNYYSNNDVPLAQVGDTETLTQNLVNVFTYQMNRWVLRNVLATLSGNYATKAGLTGIPSGVASEAFPPIGFSGPNSPSNWAYEAGNERLQYETANTFQDNLEWTHGRHYVTLGALVAYQAMNVIQPSYLGPASFSSNQTAGLNAKGALVTTTGNAYASFLLGDVGTASLADNSQLPETGGRTETMDAYAQDDWKLTNRLVVNLGLRYGISTPYIEAHNHQSWMNPVLPNPAVGNYPGAIQFAGNGTDSCNCRTQVKTDYLAFDPRIGFAYSVRPDLVVRGSYTIEHYNVGALGGTVRLAGASTLGYTANPNLVSPNGGISAAFNWNNGYPTYQKAPFIDPTLNTGFNTTTGPTAGGVTYNRPDTAGRQAYTQNWNLTLQQQLTPSTVWTISYAASSSHFLPVNGGFGIYSNQIDPKYLSLGTLLNQTETPITLAEVQAQFPSVTLPYATFDGSIVQMLKPFPQYSGVSDPYADFGNSNYNALQTYIQRTMSKELYFLVSYTWEKQIDDSGAAVNESSAGAPRSAYNLAQERSVGVSDQPQAISLAYVYGLPFGQGRAISSKSRIIDTMIGGWQLSGLQQYAAGLPLGKISASCNVPGTGGCYADYNPAFTGSVRINGAYGSGQPRGTNPPSYINVNAFQNPASFTFGTTPRTMAYKLRAPWSINEALSIGKDFGFFEHSTFRFQADAFNPFNRVVFGGINTTITSASFGQVSTQTNGARVFQLESHITF